MIESYKPHSRGLFNPIEGFSKAAYMVRIVGINETRKLLHIDFLIKCAMTKAIINFKFLDQPTIACGKTKNMV